MQLPKEMVPDPDNIELWLKVSVSFSTTFFIRVLVFELVTTSDVFKLICFTIGRWRIEAERLNQGYDI